MFAPIGLNKAGGSAKSKRRSTENWDSSPRYVIGKSPKLTNILYYLEIRFD